MNQALSLGAVAPVARSAPILDSFTVRPYAAADRSAVAHLLHQGLSARPDRRGRRPPTPCRPEDFAVVAVIEERLGLGGGLVAVDADGAWPIGACFVRRHGRHADIRALAVHPSHLGRGIAAALLTRAVGEAEAAGAETVSILADADDPDRIALNDRLGFTARQVFFAFDLTVPPDGLARAADVARIRLATPQDIGPLAALEERIVGRTRLDELALALADETGLFGTHLAEGADGAVTGFAVATRHPAFAAVGPCVAEDEETMAALIARAAEPFRGARVCILAPAAARGLIALLYAWGARLDDVRLLQMRGPFHPRAGIVLPGSLLGGG